MSRGKVIFQHEHQGAQRTLVVPVGPDEISWSYNLNTANYPTYGGEVIQILSVFIDDLHIKGTVTSYPLLEKIYSFFAEYMVNAGQGNDGHGSYNQKPMSAFYTSRQWSFYIQPLKAPGFVYSLETVAPVWELKAHIVDKTAGNYKALKDMISTQVQNKILNGEKFDLEGIVSAAAGDPTQNPFSAPGTGSGSTFKPYSPDQTKAALQGNADYYNKLIPAYIRGDFKSIIDNIGSKPAFGRGEAANFEAVEKTEKESEKGLEAREQRGK